MLLSLSPVMGCVFVVKGKGRRQLVRILELHSRTLLTSLRGASSNAHPSESLTGWEVDASRSCSHGGDMGSDEHARQGKGR